MDMIRRAAPHDLPAVMTLVREFDANTVEAAVVPLLRDDTYGVIWVTDELDAYAVVTWSWSLESGGLEAIVDEIYVRHRGRGTGSALVEHLLGDCDRRGVRRVFLETEAHNDAARRLYARFGFVAEDSIWMARVNAV
jgi:GNAT superfamily N-acetyltransferase